MKQIYYHRRQTQISRPVIIAALALGVLLFGFGVMNTLFGIAPNTAAAAEVATSTSDVTVTIVKFIDGTPATASSSNNTDYAMESSWVSSNLGTGSGSYTLGAGGYGGNTTPYQAITQPMASSSDYTTHEVINTTVGLNCTSETPFALLGYSIGDSYAAALTGTISTEAPAFTNMTTNKYVIVWNDDCATTDSDTNGMMSGLVIGGSSADGALTVTSIDRLSTTATANDSYTDGWKYRFHVTVPQDETNFSMRFTDWVHDNNVSMLLVAGNMRISTMQAASTTPITLTGSNIYSNPSLQLITDLDATTPGRQIEVLVEVKIPTATVNGNYSTTYGVRSLN